jgi:predicted nucleic acid-binding protein
MIFFFLDGSGLAKRYFQEEGTHLIDSLFDRAGSDRLIVLNIGFAEVVSVLVRRKNSGLLSSEGFGQAVLNLGHEIIDDARLRKIEPTTTLVIASLIHIQNHSVNSTDAIVLQAALVIAELFRSRGDDLAIVASDQRLLRAAQMEKLETFNPETDDQETLERLVAL